MTRREFLGLAAGSLALPGCLSRGSRACSVHQPKLAVDLSAISHYIGGVPGLDGIVEKPGAGFAKAFRALKAMGYAGVQFSGYFNNDAKTLRDMLADNGLAVCGSRVTPDEIASDKLAATCEFNQNFGNSYLVVQDDAMDVARYNAAAAQAAKYGCRIGVVARFPQWEEFFAAADDRLCLVQDVVATARDEEEDPEDVYEDFPGRSVSLHVALDGIGEIDWSALNAAANRDHVAWYVVTREKPAADLSDVLDAVRMLEQVGVSR